MDRDANKRHYFSTLSEQEKAELLKKAAAQSKEIGIWKKGASEAELKLYKITGFDDPSSTLSLEEPPTSLFGGFFEVGFEDREVFFKLTFERLHYFSRALLSCAQGGGPRLLAVDGDVFCGQQRENYRLNASKLIAIRFFADGELFECADISAGGAAVLFDPDARRPLKEGESLKDCKLNLCNRPYAIPSANVVKVWQHRDEAGRETKLCCAGVRFIDLPKETEERLFIQVNAEARGEEIQKKFFSK